MGTKAIIQTTKMASLSGKAFCSVHWFVIDPSISQLALSLASYQRLSSPLSSFSAQPLPPPRPKPIPPTNPPTPSAPTPPSSANTIAAAAVETATKHAATPALVISKATYAPARRSCARSMIVWGTLEIRSRLTLVGYAVRPGGYYMQNWQ